MAVPERLARFFNVSRTICANSSIGRTVVLHTIGCRFESYFAHCPVVRRIISDARLRVRCVHLNESNILCDKRRTRKRVSSSPRSRIGIYAAFRPQAFGGSNPLGGIQGSVAEWAIARGCKPRISHVGSNPARPIFDRGRGAIGLRIAPKLRDLVVRIHPPLLLPRKLNG